MVDEVRAVYRVGGRTVAMARAVNVFVVSGLVATVWWSRVACARLMCVCGVCVLCFVNGLMWCVCGVCVLLDSGLVV